MTRARPLAARARAGGRTPQTATAAAAMSGAPGPPTRGAIAGGPPLVPVVTWTGVTSSAEKKKSLCFVPFWLASFGTGFLSLVLHVL